MICLSSLLLIWNCENSSKRAFQKVGKIFIFSVTYKFRCPFTESSFHCVKNTQIRSFFWSIFSRIQTAYEEIRSISPYSFRMREYKDQKKLRCYSTLNRLVPFFRLFNIWNAVGFYFYLLGLIRLSRPKFLSEIQYEKLTYRDQMNTTPSDYLNINQINKTTTKKCQSVNGFWETNANTAKSGSRIPSYI